MDYAICIVPAAPVRAEDAHRSEMVNQLLYGETMAVLETRNEWLRIRSAYDDYEGWITHHLVTAILENEFERLPVPIAAGLVNPLHTPNGIMQLPMGAMLWGMKESGGRLTNGEGLWQNASATFSMSRLMETALLWRNAPYLWGGKTLMGVDCSGFVQTVFKVHGVKLPRDAWQQAQTGTKVGNIEEAMAGDLAFFHNDKGRITHVGLVMDGRRLIHASGQVRIDTLDKEGILHSEKATRTHRLHSIRRIV